MKLQISRETLPVFNVGPLGSFARIFHGAPHQIQGASLMLAELHPGEGPALHRHSYDELFVIQDGQLQFEIGSEVIVAGSGDLVIAPAGVPHRFHNAGDTLAHVTAVHIASMVNIEWLESSDS